MVSADYDIKQGRTDVEISFLPSNLIGNSESPPVIVSNDRQVNNLFTYLRKEKTAVRVCVTFKSTVGDRKSRFELDLNEETHYSSEGEGNYHHNVRGDFGSLPQMSDGRVKSEFACAEEFISVNVADNPEIYSRVVEDIKEQQYFKSKEDMKVALELCAMKHNFDYKITKSCTKFWSICCKDNACNWRIREACLQGSTYFCINKYVGVHTCAPSKKFEFSRRASAKKIGNLIKQKYEGVKEGSKPNDIMSIMHTDHGSHLSYSKAWKSREFAVNIVRGIPEQSFGKIPKYLHMLKETNPGTYTSYEYDNDGRFKYLFLSFGQCIRGFHKAIRKVIVADGTFLKSKYKGVLLVATAVYVNSNLYPIAFEIVDSENDRSWEWFFMQLKVVIADEKCLVFVSDRHNSIGKSLGNIYPLASYGICIHHLLNNVVTKFNGKGLAGLVAKASKAYIISEFEKLFDQIRNISPLIGRYLEDANVKKWARCQFPGYRFEIRTTNPAESINSALRSPREYPIIPLLDSLREMLTRWFYERKAASTKHNRPLTIDVEKKIARRIEKAKTLISLPSSINRFQFKGETLKYVVDLKRKTCLCRKFDLEKIPCIHAIKGAFSRNIEIHTLADYPYSTTAWRTAYEKKY